MRICFALFPLLLIGGMAGATAPDADPLQRNVLSGFSYESIDDAIHIIERRTEFKVSLSSDISEPLRAFRTHLECGDDHSKASATEFLDRICRSLGLRWEFDRRSNILSLDVAWRRSDTRNPAELLKSLKHFEPRQMNFAQILKRNPSFFGDEKWQAAFDALLSEPQNFGKAWRVRQRSLFEGFPGNRIYMADAPLPPPLMKPLLERRIIARNLQAYTIVILDHPMWFSPGHGSVSYYWFEDEGTLVGAGLMNTGHRCKLIDATISPDLETGGPRKLPFKQPSELQMILQNNGASFYVARYALGPDGFEVLGLIDASGAPLGQNNREGMHLGESLIERSDH